MSDFEKLKYVFLSLGFDIERYKVNEFHYLCEVEEFRSDKFDLLGYYEMTFEVKLNEDYTIKKLSIGSWP